MLLLFLLIFVTLFDTLFESKYCFIKKSVIGQVWYFLKHFVFGVVVPLTHIFTLPSTTTVNGKWTAI